MDMKKKLSNKGEARLNVLKDLRKTASEAMGEGIKGIRKVTVAADSKEDLAKGLKIAEKLADQDPKDMMDKDKMSAMLGADQGEEEEYDTEEQESEEDDQEMESEDTTAEDLDKQIEELLKKKQELKLKV